MTNQNTPAMGAGDDRVGREMTAEDLALATAASLGLGPNEQLEMMNVMRRAEQIAEAPARTLAQGGATVEQIEAATWALINWDSDIADRGVSDEHYRERRAEVERIAPILSVSASADPADEHHDAEERQAESEDYAATVTGGVEISTENVRQTFAYVQAGLDHDDGHPFVMHVHIEQFDAWLAEVQRAAALVDPAKANEAKLAEAKYAVDSVHQIHGTECTCGFASQRSRSRTEHITAALISELRGVGR